VLRSQTFDLVVLPKLSDDDQHRIVNLADGAQVLVLDGLTMPQDLLALVAERLNGGRRPQANRMPVPRTNVGRCQSAGKP
jgi:hypothetical protein